VRRSAQGDEPLSAIDVVAGDALCARPFRFHCRWPVPWV
jgi:hypothetical protein